MATIVKTARKRILNGGVRKQLVSLPPGFDGQRARDAARRARRMERRLRLRILLSDQPAAEDFSVPCMHGPSIGQ